MTPTDLILAAASSPSTPSPITTAPEPMSVTPGLTGFAVIFAVAVALLLLMVDMSRRMRRLRYRAEVAEAEQTDQSRLVQGRHQA